MNANIDPVPLALWSIPALAALVGVGALCRLVVDNPRQDVLWGIARILARVYARVVHRVTVEGIHNVPFEPHPGRLIVTVNHTSGVDPILVQAACPFDIRWMMAADMQFEFLRWAWEFLRVISVDRQGRDTGSAREAIRHLRSEGVIGIFPEGAIERPRERIMPFFPGVGLLISRSQAPVLPVLIKGTPHTRTAWMSLIVRSRATVRFYPIIRYEAGSPEQITRDLRSRYFEWSGWPPTEAPEPRDASAPSSALHEPSHPLRQAAG